MGEIEKVVGQWIAANVPWAIAIGIFIFLLVFEVSKIKVYPLKWLWKCISWPFKKIDEQRTSSFKNIVLSMKKDIDDKITTLVASTNLNCETLKTRFDSLEKRFDSIDIKQMETEERLDLLAAARIKNHVLNFSRQCRKGEKHSKEDFANLFKENVEYEKLVKKYEWKNDVYVQDFAYVKEMYAHCLRTDDFLA